MKWWALIGEGLNVDLKQGIVVPEGRHLFYQTHLINPQLGIRES